MVLSPKWYPVSVLPGLIKHMEDRLIGDQKQFDTLLRAKALPWSLDDRVVGELIQLYSDRKDMMIIFSEQLDRWESEDKEGIHQESFRRLAQKIRNCEALRKANRIIGDRVKKSSAKSYNQRNDDLEYHDKFAYPGVKTTLGDSPRGSGSGGGWW